MQGELAKQIYMNGEKVLDNVGTTCYNLGIVKGTDGTSQGAPPNSENVICRTCTDSVVEELRTPHIENATGNRFTTEW